ncbi:MAG: SDR family NAD(P)-dependent oxidoreductase [Clostridiales bacterium]|nr:SDR family NAD(P)-dependent oxidoreductase [Clostridiales bacterium]
MGYKINGATVILSGASSGIGFELARLLVQECGCHVIGIGRRADKLLDAAAKINTGEGSESGYFEFRAFDVTDASGWQALCNELKSTNIQPDVLINNAGILPPFARFSTGGGAETVRKTTELNFLSQASAIEIMLPLLLDSKRGAIINVSSSSSLCALPGSAAYSASKAASRAFTEALACEYSGRLYIASVCPGFTKTPIFDGQKPGIDRFLIFSTSPEKMARRILGGIRRGRRLIVRGVDAHAMNLLYRCFGTYGERLCASVLRRFGGEVFSDCFEKKADTGKPDNLS